MATHYFTVDEANRTLPFLKRVVTDIVNDYARWQEHVRRYELATGAVEDETGEMTALRGEVEALATRIDGYLAELEAVGCLFKGFEDGLVDFYAKRDGRDIFLCWRLGEDTVRYWHEIDAGFAGRQPLEPARTSDQAK